MFRARVQPTEANAKTRKAANSNGRLPIRSDNGPMISWTMAVTAKYPDTDQLTVP